MHFTEYRVQIDDRDRDGAPDTPWTATLYDSHDSSDAVAVGVGHTISAALHDLAGQAGTANLPSVNGQSTST